MDCYTPRSVIPSPLSGRLHHCLCPRYQRMRALSCAVSVYLSQLHDASIVVRPGRTFLQRLLDLLKSSHHRKTSAFIRLNCEARSVILWWHCSISHWNGLSMMQDDKKACPDMVLAPPPPPPQKKRCPPNS